MSQLPENSVVSAILELIEEFEPVTGGASER